MQVIGYLDPPTIKDRTLTLGVILDVTEIQGAHQHCLQNGFQNIFQTCHLLFKAFVSRTVDYSHF